MRRKSRIHGIFPGILLGVLLLTSCARPSNSQPPAHTDLPPVTDARENPKGPTLSATDPDAADPKELEELASRFAAALPAQFERLLAPLKDARPGCGDAVRLEAYQRALRIAGRMGACAAEAERCRVELDGKPGFSGVLYEAGRCRTLDYAFREARGLYAESIRLLPPGAPGRAARIAGFARFALMTQYESEAEGILRGNPEWAADASRILGAIERVSTGDSKRASAAETEAVYKSWVESPDPELRDFARRHWASYLASYRYLHTRAARILAQDLDGIASAPDDWVRIAYGALYRQKDGSLELPRRVYQAFLPYAHPRSWLPTEQNTYTYTELYQGVCRETLLAGAAFSEWQKLKEEWLTGKATTEEAFARAQALARDNPRKADLLSFLGGLHETLGDDGSASGAYWQAHLVCPYFHRSHWGISGIERRIKNRAYDDYSRSLETMARILGGVTFPAEIERYVVNWPALSGEVRDRLRFAMRFWVPYVPMLERAGARVYVKQAFQLLSETPGSSNLRDARIVGGSYADDKRLWDDVRGAGGKIVIVDSGEMREAPFGGYNLAGHEIAHQFHRELPAPLGRCITVLYDRAKARGVFADPYMASNEREYFAQGVTYTLVPEESPKRYGITAAWVAKNDPDLAAFLASIATAAGDVSAIRCPIPTE